MGLELSHVLTKSRWVVEQNNGVGINSFHDRRTVTGPITPSIPLCSNKDIDVNDNSVLETGGHNVR